MTGEQLRAWRQRQRLTQAALAEQLRVSKLTVIRWEGGQQSPPEFLDLALQRIEQLLRAGVVMRSKWVKHA